MVRSEEYSRCDSNQHCTKAAQHNLLVSSGGKTSACGRHASAQCFFFFFLRGAFPFCDFQIYWHSRGPSPVMHCFSTHQCALRRACHKLTKKFLLHKEKAALWCRSILVLCALLSDEYFCPYQSSLPHTGLSAFISLQPEYSFMIEAAK